MLGRIKNYINYNYGSRRGWLNHHKFALHHRLGFFSQYANIDWNRVERLVFICHGNICRSPLAEAVARRAGVQAVSFGLHCSDGREANIRAVNFADSIGLSLFEHRTNNIRHYVPSSNDLIVVMEPAHLLELSKLPSNHAQITLAGLWLPAANPYLHDPYSAVDDFFVLCESRVERAACLLVQQMISKSANAATKGYLSCNRASE
jgi:protein-tyrosine phosphatase